MNKPYHHFLFLASLNLQGSEANSVKIDIIAVSKFSVQKIRALPTAVIRARRRWFRHVNYIRQMASPLLCIYTASFRLRVVSVPYTILPVATCTSASASQSYRQYKPSSSARLIAFRTITCDECMLYTVYTDVVLDFPVQLHPAMSAGGQDKLYEDFDLHVVGHDVVLLCEVNWWRYVTLFKWNWISSFLAIRSASAIPN